MEGTLRQQAECFLGAEIPSPEWDKATVQAERKLKRIIAREGDADGKRREPWYLAQLIAETVKGSCFSRLTFEIAALDKYADEHIGTKKGQPV